MVSESLFGLNAAVNKEACSVPLFVVEGLNFVWRSLSIDYQINNAH